MLAKSLSELDVSNVYIYVGDAVRDDYLSDSIQDRGISTQTIAASTHSPTSFASLLTGKYPPHHGVETFTNRINPETPRLFDITETETSFVNSIFEFAAREHSDVQDPIYSVLNIDQAESISIDQISSPFVLMERGPGGHAPYGDYDQGASEYFLDRAESDTDAIRSDYVRSIERDAELFEQRVDTLRNRGLLNDTLIIYTSDHGEMLGENGLLGHNGPMCPELVYVPTVFIHPELQSVTETDNLIHHVDILPTICDLLQQADEYIPGMDGKSLLSNTASDPRPCFWSNTFLPSSIPLLSGQIDYSGVWDTTGGHVFTKTTLPNRIAVLCGKILYSAKRSYMRRHAGSCIRAYLNNDTTYGEPEFSENDARQILENVSTDTTESVDTGLTDDGRQRLQDLGYLE